MPASPGMTTVFMFAFPNSPTAQIYLAETKLILSGTFLN
jgi:hypothetical protein